MENFRSLAQCSLQSANYPKLQGEVSDFKRASASKVDIFRFGRFVIEVQTRLLVCDGTIVELGSRAFDLLLVLVQSPGTVVSKERILSNVWPSTHVDESNIRFQMGQVRGALGRDRSIVKTVPGRGYILTVPVTAVQQSAEIIDGKTDTVATRSGDKVFPQTDISQSEAPVDRPVVVIDDDADIRAALEDLLESFGLRTEAFANVGEYMASPRNSKPGCFILDVWLPDQSGLVFQGKLSQTGIDIPIIFITGHLDVHICVQAMKAGAHDFLTKPVRYSELIDAIFLALSRER